MYNCFPNSSALIINHCRYKKINIMSNESEKPKPVQNPVQTPTPPQAPPPRIETHSDPGIPRPTPRPTPIPEKKK
jgi:hypothetical protein